MNKKDAIRNAVAIIEMEGYTITEENLKLIEKCISGELTVEQLIYTIINEVKNDLL